jgi:hypothetical protein
MVTYSGVNGELPHMKLVYPNCDWPIRARLEIDMGTRPTRVVYVTANEHPRE